jgi:predicted aconitase
MELTAEEQAMLNGELGGPVKRAIELQIEVGKFFGVRRAQQFRIRSRGDGGGDDRARA